MTSPIRIDIRPEIRVRGMILGRVAMPLGNRAEKGKRWPKIRLHLARIDHATQMNLLIPARRGPRQNVGPSRQPRQYPGTPPSQRTQRQSASGAEASHRRPAFRRKIPALEQRPTKPMKRPPIPQRAKALKVSCRAKPVTPQEDQGDQGTRRLFWPTH